MKFMRRIQTLSVASLLLFFVGFGCSPAQKTVQSNETTPDQSWQYTHIVDYEFVKPHTSIPATPNVMLIDSRPKRAMFDKGHIPNSVSIPDSQFDKMIDQLPENKDDLLIFYCGGFACKLSHKSAYKAEKLGYKNIKVFAAGYPEWMKHKGNYPTVSVDYMQNMIAKNQEMMIIDSRPKRMQYDKGHLPNAVSIPDSQFAKMTDQLPADKDKLLVFYCGGFHCKLSHKSAAKAMDLGYTNVTVFAAGYPAWAKVAEDSKVKGGSEEGTIDVANFEQILKNAPQSILLVDVRDADEFAAGKFPTAINIPTDQLEGRIASLPTEKPVVFVCATGARSGEAYYMVQDLRPELKNIFYLEAQITYNGNSSHEIVGTP